jgi:type VI secretion system protein VasD
MKNLIKLTIALVSIITLTACSTSTPQMETTIQSVNFLNPNIYNQASPVVITIYQLKSPATFQQASFFTLYNNPINTLASDLLDKRDIEIRPQQQQTLNIMLSPQTNYIGVLAAFRDPDKAQWRQVLQVDPGKNIEVQISVATQSVTLKLK